MTRRPYRPALPYVQRTGRYHYFRYGGFPIVRLPGEPFSTEYLAAYNAAYAQAFDRPAPLPLLPPSLLSRVGRPRGGSSYVYIIGDLHDGPVKIGLSTKPKKRLRQLQASSPTKLKILAKFPGDAKVEAALHWRFKSYRMQGEWFERGDAIRFFLVNVSRGIVEHTNEEEPSEVDLWLAAQSRPFPRVSNPEAAR